MVKEFKTAYGPKPRVTIDTGEESLVQQAHKDQCDINQIMKRFVRTGVIDHFNRHAPQYGEIDGTDFKMAMDQVARAKTMFNELPARARANFENDPAKFLDFVGELDPASTEDRQKLVELGIAREGLQADLAQEAAQAAAEAAQAAQQSQPEA